jgi:hypothetical protein
MQWANFKALVKAHKGWIEGEKAYFPTPHLKDCFEAACEAAESAWEAERERRDAMYYNALAKGELTRTSADYD